MHTIFPLKAASVSLLLVFGPDTESEHAAIPPSMRFYRNNNNTIFFLCSAFWRSGTGYYTMNWKFT
jgi:hypothetical protein